MCGCTTHHPPYLYPHHACHPHQALLQHATNPAEAAASYAQLLAQPIVAEAVAEARVAADEGELVRRPSLQLKFLALKNLALLEADRGERRPASLQPTQTLAQTLAQTLELTRAVSPELRADLT